MAENFMINVEESFNMDAFTQQIAEQYRMKGFNVNVLKQKNGAKIVFDKKCGGINMLLGLGQGITANCSLRGKENDTLYVNFSDGDWTGKIVGFIVGWFLCFIPIVTAAFGAFKQMGLPKEISNEMQMMINEM